MELAFHTSSWTLWSGPPSTYLNVVTVYVHIYADVYIIINGWYCNLNINMTTYICIQVEHPISGETHHEPPGYIWISGSYQVAEPGL